MHMECIIHLYTMYIFNLPAAVRGKKTLFNKAGQIVDKSLLMSC